MRASIEDRLVDYLGRFLYRCGRAARVHIPLCMGARIDKSSLFQMSTAMYAGTMRYPKRKHISYEALIISEARVQQAYLPFYHTFRFLQTWTSQVPSQCTCLLLHMPRWWTRRRCVASMHVITRTRRELLRWDPIPRSFEVWGATMATVAVPL